MAFPALQFDASISRSMSRTDGCVVAWASTRGGIIASPCHTNGSDWAAPQYDDRGVVGFAAAIEEDDAWKANLELRNRYATPGEVEVSSELRKIPVFLVDRSSQTVDAENDTARYIRVKPAQ